METIGTNNCELPSYKFYSNFYQIQITKTSSSVCDSIENISLGVNANTVEKMLSEYNNLKDFCYKLEANLQNLKIKDNLDEDLKKTCTHLQL
ncbi:hypothetical protein POVWA2_080470 [Plasmodium ovale wallikeri]|uniref:PIR Superfamily Protein n=1 Tax=Plasmodium ovale wallikeri TaxID=864142 RepID=A0A1A9ANB4_PLAOA|nr:hypothetical protein POVWA2_080470 [Plasmodium ovale wallikeri]SBT58464.1 hypothetical protein POVWA1_087830 [Plasmodium ovale wallikeri]